MGGSIFETSIHIVLSGHKMVKKFSYEGMEKKNHHMDVLLLL